MELRSERYRKKRRKKWLKIIGIIFLLLIIALGAYAYSIYKSLTDAVDSMHQPLDRERSEKRSDDINFGKRDPFSVLLLGVDERQGDKGRSDTMIVLTVNPKKESIKMLSIPRDTRTEIVGRGTVDKINHAYAFGGEKMAIDSVENFLDIPIDHYGRINMEGFKDLVDAVGGITVHNDFEFKQDGYTFQKGLIYLDGDKALSYVRMRKADPRGDFGRQERQRKVIQGVINKGLSISSITRFDNILDALGSNVRTDLTFSEMMDIQKNYRAATRNIEQMEISGKGQMINGIYYYIVSDAEKQRIQNELKEHLEII